MTSIASLRKETAAFRSLVAKRETSSLCKWERRLLRITTCDTRRGRGWGASSVSEAWRSGCGENPISSSLLSFLASCEWHKSPKINLSVEWKASWGASDWTSIIYGISRGWHHGSRGRGGDQSRYRCKFGHLHRQCNALQLPHIERRAAASICCHLVNRLHLRWTAHGAGGLIYEEGGRGTETAKRSEQSAK